MGRDVVVVVVVQLISRSLTLVNCGSTAQHRQTGISLLLLPGAESRLALLVVVVVFFTKMLAAHEKQGITTDATHAHTMAMMMMLTLTLALRVRMQRNKYAKGRKEALAKKGRERERLLNATLSDSSLSLVRSFVLSLALTQQSPSK